MKKFAKILAAVMLVAIVAMTFASCGLFGLNLEKAEDRLEDENYQVYHYKDYDDADYYTQMMVAYMFEELGIDDEPSAVLGGTKGDEAFYAVKFKKSSEANDAYKNAKKNWDDFSEDAEGDLTYGKQGNVIYFGSVDAVKTALGFPSNIFVFEK